MLTSNMDLNHISVQAWYFLVLPCWQRLFGTGIELFWRQSVLAQSCFGPSAEIDKCV